MRKPNPRLTDTGLEVVVEIRAAAFLIDRPL
jgi:hypothetical protein